MSRLLRTAGLLAALTVALPFASAADTKSIDQAIDKGKAFLKGRYARGAADSTHGIGPAALSGVAMLEARVPADDPAIKVVTAAVREAAYSESKTYQTALCLIYLDRLEDPADVPLVQMLALRLLAGQNGNGGWGYTTCGAISNDQIQWLRANLKVEVQKERDPKAPKPAARLHPDVATYATSLTKPAGPAPDDNSNTQFAILGLWLARKHGVQVEGALDLIEKRFRATQDARTGGWGYMGPMPGGVVVVSMSSPSMTCCGLLGLATGNARRIEKRPKEPNPMVKSPMAKDDPFFTTPVKGEKTTEKGPEIRDPSAVKGLAGLGSAYASYAQNGGVLAPNERHGDRDLYFLWSVERVGVIYNVDKLGGVDWYEVGADAIVKAQGAEGAWGGQYGAEVNTSFALLFLCKADLLRDLSNKFRNAKDNELRAGNSGAVPNGGTGTETAPMPKNTNPPLTPLPNPTQDPSTKLANELILAPATDWSKALEKLRDAKGAENTKGLVVAIRRLEGDRKKEAREALAERLTRMSAETLKGMMTAEEAELRRGAVLAAAMKDDKTHVPDLIERLLDDEELVVRAAKAGLKSLTLQDHGPKAGATKDECKAAVAAWKAWWAMQK